MMDVHARPDHATAIDEFTALLKDLESVGLHTEVRAGYDQSLLVFLKAPKALLGNTVYKSRYVVRLRRPWQTISMLFTESRTGCMELRASIQEDATLPPWTGNSRQRTFSPCSILSPGKRSSAGLESLLSLGSGRTSSPCSLYKMCRPIRPCCGT